MLARHGNAIASIERLERYRTLTSDECLLKKRIGTRKASPSPQGQGQCLLRRSSGADIAHDSRIP